MIFSPTAKLLTRAIDASSLSQREISDRVGFKNSNIISMMKSGETRVPLNRIPALAAALEVNEQEFLLLAIQEYHPGVHEVLVDVLGIPLSEAELGILAMYRMGAIRGELEVSEPFKKALEGLLELTANVQA